jgi:hypothetical protein
MMQKKGRLPTLDDLTLAVLATQALPTHIVVFSRPESTTVRRLCTKHFMQRMQGYYNTPPGVLTLRRTCDIMASKGWYVHNIVPGCADSCCPCQKAAYGKRGMRLRLAKNERDAVRFASLPTGKNAVLSKYGRSAGWVTSTYRTPRTY